jgi:glycogen debranching enzyme
MEPAFKDNDYDQRPGVLPAGPIEFAPISDEEAQGIVAEYLDRSWLALRRDPRNHLKYPYLVPGATYEDMWDWDAFFMASAVPDSSIDVVQGSALNLLDAPSQKDGRPPKKASVDCEYSYYLHPYPLRAQFAYLAGKRMGDFAWIDPFRKKLLQGIRWYESATCDADGFFLWQTLTGIDNNPSIYGRPPGTVAGVDLAAFHYREYRALAKLARELGWDCAEEFNHKAERLKLLVQGAYWDTVDEFFYDVDRAIDHDVPGRQLVNWHTHLKFRNWSCLYPLWAGMATAEQAAILRDAIMSESEYLAPCGVRSHSKRDPVYNNARTGGPSNWQGPAWGLSTFVTAYGLARYGYADDAREVAMRLIRTFALDIRQNGCIHEYYDGDTGQPAIKPGFLSWNLLARVVMDDLENGADSTTLDILTP